MVEFHSSAIRQAVEFAETETRTMISSGGRNGELVDVWYISAWNVSVILEVDAWQSTYYH